MDYNAAADISVTLAELSHVVGYQFKGCRLFNAVEQRKIFGSRESPKKSEGRLYMYADRRSNGVAVGFAYNPGTSTEITSGVGPSDAPYEEVVLEALCQLVDAAVEVLEGPRQEQA